MKKKKLLAIGTLAATAAAALLAKKKSDALKSEKLVEDSIVIYNHNEDTHAYLIGGGLASMAAAAYLIQDGGLQGPNIHIMESMNILGGSNDGSGDIEHGFLCRGGRMLNEETYENFWDLFKTIPSIEYPGRSVTEEILSFDHAHPTHAKARLVDKNGKILNVHSMGFNTKDRLLLGKLINTKESKLDDLTIEDWFKSSPHFFTTNFWHMWQTTFAFQTWSSLFEFRRYMERMIFEFSRIETLAGVTRTQYNQYESVILPIQTYLEANGVDFKCNCKVVDIDFSDDEHIYANTLHLDDNHIETTISLRPQDLCIMTNGCMSDNATLGDFNHAPEYICDHPVSFELWEKIANKKEGLGNPLPFCSKPHESNWESFTVTMKGNKLLKLIEKFSNNIPGSGALMTFKDSSWKMSIVVAAQPHFKNQPLDSTIFWAYGLYTDHIGDYVKKPMLECTGEELMIELLHHLHFEEQLDEIMASVTNVIPCMMPYIDSQFLPRKMSDRPLVVPNGSKNFAMISQFVEISEDMVFTEEYSVRAARIAVYKLLGIQKKICPVTPYNKDPKVLLKALKTAYR
ncbi:MAG: oleate hydratase [Erysipelotrichaceae bacterium]